MVWRYIWDGENRLTEIQPLTNNPAESKRWLKYSYDWRSRRIQKTAASWNTNTSAWSLTLANRFLYTGWNLLGELNATNNALIRGYIWGLDLSGSLQGAGGVGGLVAINDTATGAHFAAYDDSGNVAGFVKGSDGSVSAQYEYDPFGQLIRATGPFAQANPLRFSTKYFDDEIGLSYYGYRYYNPSLGRWLNRDPIQEFGGFNIYGFCYNNSQEYVDGFGLSDGGWTDYIPDWFPNWWGYDGDYSPAPKRSWDPISKASLTGVDNDFNGKKASEVAMDLLIDPATDLALNAIPAEKLLDPLAKIFRCRIGKKLKAEADAAEQLLKEFKRDAGKMSHWDGMRASRGFKSFEQLKKHLGSPGEGNVWNHIVEQ